MTSIRQLLDRIRNIPGLGRDVLALVLVVAAGLACGVYIFSQYGWSPPLQQRVQFKAEFEMASGVRPESREEVRIAGVPIGKIESAEPLPDGHALLGMSLDPGNTVYKNAHVVLRSKSPLNIPYVELDPGGPPAQPLPPNGSIPASQTERGIEPYELFDKLDERTRTALTSLLDDTDVALAQAPQKLPAGLQATDRTIKTFQPVMAQLQTRRDTIAQVITALSQISTAAGHDDTRVATLTTSLEQTLGVLGKRDNQLDSTLGQLPGLARNIDSAMLNTRGLTGQLNPTLDALKGASGQLPSTLQRLTQTVDTAGKVVHTARPVVREARPVATDLRPLTGDLNASFGDLAPVTGYLPKATSKIVPWLDDLAAFVYQTSSSFSLGDANGGFGRANLTLDISNPLGGFGEVQHHAGKNEGGK
jgi:phospholipid/cholesterol/gamma-HCH transport system substrate-binding protein